MNIRQEIFCPNCGEYAEKYNSPDTKTIRTSCSCCDYLLVQCSDTGRVIEAYAPGLIPAGRSKLSTSSIGR